VNGNNNYQEIAIFGAHTATDERYVNFSFCFVLSGQASYSAEATGWSCHGVTLFRGDVLSGFVTGAIGSKISCSNFVSPASMFIIAALKGDVTLEGCCFVEYAVDPPIATMGGWVSVINCWFAKEKLPTGKSFVELTGVMVNCSFPTIVIDSDAEAAVCATPVGSCPLATPKPVRSPIFANSAFLIGTLAFGESFPLSGTALYPFSGSISETAAAGLSERRASLSLALSALAFAETLALAISSSAGDSAVQIPTIVFPSELGFSSSFETTLFDRTLSFDQSGSADTEFGSSDRIQCSAGAFSRAFKRSHPIASINLDWRSHVIGASKSGAWVFPAISARLGDTQNQLRDIPQNTVTVAGASLLTSAFSEVRPAGDAISSSAVDLARAETALTAGSIIGIVIGGIVLITALVAGLWFGVRRESKTTEVETGTETSVSFLQTVDTFGLTQQGQSGSEDQIWRDEASEEIEHSTL
jgi:hypothetical protein